MRVTREEIEELANRADTEGQYGVADRLRCVAVYLDLEHRETHKADYSAKAVRAIEKSLLEMREI